MEFNILDKVLLHIFKRYSNKIYRRGIQDEFNWNNKTNTQGCTKAVPTFKIKKKI
ncbi:MAG: hypothetical protein HFJ36_03275 [Clostridia bacterium]|nr:hypothetical protein [Clostridia bacterium]